MQTKTHSLIESITNTAIGYIIALCSQLIILPLYGIEVNFNENIQIALWFTLISLVRSYFVRRWFNGFRN